MPPKKAFSTDIETSIFPELIKKFKSFHPIEERERTLIIMQQHRVLSLGWMLDMAQSLGFKPEHLYVLGKSYSDSDAGLKYIDDHCSGVKLYPRATQLDAGDDVVASTEQAVREMLADVRLYVELNPKLIKSILLLDDGGDVIDATVKGIDDGRYEVLQENDRKFAAAEMTTRGTKKILESHRKTMPFPYIPCSSSIIKKMGSGHFPEASWRVLQPILRRKRKPIVGIVGYGNIGKGVEKLLKSHGIGFEPFPYDKSINAWESIPPGKGMTFEEQLKTADILFGATGTDWTKNNLEEIIDALLERDKPITFVSMSSERVEFDTLIDRLAEEYPDSFKHQKEGDRHSDIKVTVGDCEVTFFYGGYPANFSPVEELDNMRSLYPEDAQVYQAELGVAIMIMGLAVASKYNTRQGAANFLVMNPILEQFVASLTLKKNPTLFRYCSRQEIERLNILSAIVSNSDHDYDNRAGTHIETGVEFGCDVFVTLLDKFDEINFSRSALVGIYENYRDYNWLWIDFANRLCRQVFALGANNRLLGETITVKNQGDFDVRQYVLPGQDGLLLFYRYEIYQELVFLHLKRKISLFADCSIELCTDSLSAVQREVVMLELLWRKENDKLISQYHHLWQSKAVETENVASVERLWLLRFLNNVYKAASFIGVPASIVRGQALTPLIESVRVRFDELLSLFDSPKECLKTLMMYGKDDPEKVLLALCQDYSPFLIHYVRESIIDSVMHVTFSKSNTRLVKYELNKALRLNRQIAMQVSQQIGDCDMDCQDRLSILKSNVNFCLDMIKRYLHSFNVAAASAGDWRCRVLHTVIGEIDIIEDRLRNDLSAPYLKSSLSVAFGELPGIKKGIDLELNDLKMRVNNTALFLPFCRSDITSDECAARTVDFWQQRDVIAKDSATEMSLCKQAADLFELPESKLFSEIFINPIKTISWQSFLAGFVVQFTGNLCFRIKVQDEICYLIIFLTQLFITLPMTFSNPFASVLVKFGLSLFVGLLQLILGCPQGVANLMTSALFVAGNGASVWYESGRDQALFEMGRQAGLILFSSSISRVGCAAANKLLPRESSLLDLADAKREVPRASKRGFFARIRTSMESMPELAASLGLR